MKSLFITSLRVTTCVILLFSILTSFSNDKTSKKTKFKFAIKFDKKEVLLTSKKGFDWKEIKLSLNTDEVKLIDNSGLIANKDTKNSILFSITRNGNGLKLTGIKGTYWIELTCICKNDECFATVDETGVKIK